MCSGHILGAKPINWLMTSKKFHLLCCANFSSLLRTYCTPHSSKSARLASEAFFFIISQLRVENIL
jgi:hypothetical protein